MASKKVSTLNALTSAGDDDLLYIADTSDSGASYASKRITVQNFLNGTASADGLAQEISDRTSGDTALSNRLDVLEADPTTATAVAAAIAVETAARQAADALALPLTGGTLSGNLELGASGGPASATFPIKSVVDFGPNYENITVSLTTTGTPGQWFAHDDPSESDHVAGTWGNFPGSIDGVSIDENTLRQGNAFTPGKRWWAFGYGANNSVQITINSTESFTSYTQSGFDYNTPVVHGGGGGSATTIGADGTATFGGAISASTAPTDDAHLVNKQYADSLVAGVDLSGIATNADAIAAETAARIAADALKLDLAGGTVTGNITATTAPTAAGHLVNKQYADNLVAGVDLSGIATNAAAIEALTNGAPELLNTLAELGDAIGDDENFAATITGQIGAETTARTNADTALSGRLDALEADPTTATDLAAESSARASADTALSNRLDTLEADPTTQTLLDAETAARTAADTAETNARTSADSALSGRLDTLEADPTTQTLLDAETAARIAGDALKLDLAGGTLTGDLNIGAVASGGTWDSTTLRGATTLSNNDKTFNTSSDEGGREGALGGFTLPETGKFYWEIKKSGDLDVGIGLFPDATNFASSTWIGSQNGHYGIRVTYSGSQIYNGTTSYSQLSSSNVMSTSLDTTIGIALDRDAGELKFYRGGVESSQYAFGIPSTHQLFGVIMGTSNSQDASVTIRTEADDWEFAAPAGFEALPSGGSGGATTIAVDGTATFSGNVTADAAPTAAGHLVNKLYADNLVAGVDLSGIATNAAAIEALTNGAPELLNTLNELANAIGDDENFATTVTNTIAAETTARTNADTALSGRLDTLEADPTTATAVTNAIATETSARQAADTAEASARTSADNALSGRLDTLEADPTTGAALTAETNARISADTALSNRLDTLEADPTTQTLLDAETAARTAADTAEANARAAADALLLPLAGGTMTGAIQLGTSSGGTEERTTTILRNALDGTDLGLSIAKSSTWYDYLASELAPSGQSYVEIEVGSAASNEYRKMIVGTTTTDDVRFDYYTTNLNTTVLYIEDAGPMWRYRAYSAGVKVYDQYYQPALENGSVLGILIDRDAGTLTYSIDGTDVLTVNGQNFSDPNLFFGWAGQRSSYEVNFGATAFAHQPAGVNGYNTNTVVGSASTIGVDGTATFAGNITASTAPTDAAHLVNKLYADNLVAGVDLSGIATNAAAIEALTNGAPELLNTLNELAQAIGDDENFSTTVTNQIAAETTARTNADNALSGRLDTLEADPTTQTALTAESVARTNADNALSGRLDTLEADPTTATDLAAEATARTNADNALSGRLDTLEADPTTQTLLDAEATARANADTLLDGRLDTLEADPTTATALAAEATTRANADTALSGRLDTLEADPTTATDVTNAIAVETAAREAADTAETNARIAADALKLDLAGGTVTGNITASTAPTADGHLVNKLYADNLVAGVDLSGIAANAAAIQALTNGAPELLNTLQELAAALGDDANFSTTVTGQIAANEVHIDNVATLSGVAKDSTNLGAFTGSTISDTSTIKAALQALETAIETPSAASQIQTIEQTANGTFHVTFVDSNNGSATAESLFTDSGLTYNPSTDLLSGGSIDMTTLLLDGVEVTATGAELNFLGGLTSSVQTQLDGKVTTGANINTLVGDTVAGDVPVDVNGTDNYLFLVIDKANGALTAIDKTFLEAE